MSDILIKGMEMPQNCQNCMDANLNIAISLFGAMCPFCEKIFVADINIRKQRLKDCPLIETVIEDEVVIPLGTLSKILDRDRTAYDFSEYICGVNGLACSGCSLFCEHRRMRE